MVEAAGLSPRQITLECTEQQAVPDVVRSSRQVKALRRLGFGFAIDDAGAGYASFTLIAALRPSIIKIDREIAARRSPATTPSRPSSRRSSRSGGGSARGCSPRASSGGPTWRCSRSLGVDLGQGYLIGRPAYVPQAPRPFAELRPDRAKAGKAAASRVRHVVPKRGHRPAGA